MAGQPSGNAILTFDVTNLTINEPGQPDSTVIEDGADFDLKVDFEFDQFLALFLVSLGIKCDVTVQFESLGTGPEGVVGPVTVTTVAGQKKYTGTLHVLHTDPLSTVGSYRLAGTVVIPGSGIAGFVDGNILQIIPD